MTTPNETFASTGREAAVLVVGQAHSDLLHGLAALRLRIELVGDAGAALIAWERLQPALVILFPDTEPDGWVFCRSIRRTSLVPILVVTASRSLDDVEDAIAWGANDYLVLPLTAHELAARALALVARTAQTAGCSPTTGRF